MPWRVGHPPGMGSKSVSRACLRRNVLDVALFMDGLSVSVSSCRGLLQMRQAKTSLLSSSSKSGMACIRCRIFAGSGSFSARKSLAIHQRRSHKRFARVMTQRNGALPLGQWGKSVV